MLFYFIAAQVHGTHAAAFLVEKLAQVLSCWPKFVHAIALFEIVLITLLITVTETIGNLFSKWFWILPAVKGFTRQAQGRESLLKD